MEIVHTLLRLLHILAGFTWFGLGLSFTLLIAPSLARGSEGAFRFFRNGFNPDLYERAITIAAVTTLVAGLLLYFVSNSAAYFSTVGNAVLGTGALFGVLAVGHGGAAAGRATQRLNAAVGEYIPAGGAIPADRLATLHDLGRKVAVHARISTVLTLIALIGMASARYL